MTGSGWRKALTPNPLNTGVLLNARMLSLLKVSGGVQGLGFRAVGVGFRAVGLGLSAASKAQVCRLESFTVSGLLGQIV